MSDETLLVYEDDQVEPIASTALVLGVDLAFAAALGVAIWQRARARRAIAAAEACVVPTAPLFERQRFLAGTVELAEGEPLAVRVTVTQAGVERAVKNGRVHDWVETDRAVEARPFYVRHASGARVRVEVPASADDVVIVDALDQREWSDRALRRRRAELTPGEPVIVEGRLGREHDPEAQGAQSYRDAAAGWVMRPPRDRRMLLSSESLAHKHRLRRRALGVAIGVIVTLWGIAELPLLGFRLRQLQGQDVVLPYAGKRAYSSRNSKGHLTQHWVVDFRQTIGQTTFNVAAPIDGSDYQRLPIGPGKVRVRDVASPQWATALGRGSSVNIWGLIAATVLCAAGWIKLRFTLAHKRWYERGVDERNQQGPLPLPSGERFLDPPAPGAPGPPRGASPAVRPVR